MPFGDDPGRSACVPDHHAPSPTRHPSKPDPPAWLGLDASHATHADFVERFAATWPMVAEAMGTPRVAPATAAAEHGRITAWLRWATLPTADGGGGLAATAEALPALEVRVLREGAWSWWRWMHSPVRDDHPLMWDHVRRQLGDRCTTDPIRGWTAQKYAVALRAWGREHGIDDITRLIDRATAAERPRPTPAREKLVLTAADVHAVIDVLERRAVPLRLRDEVLIDLWHLRQLAAFLIQILGVLRISEVGRLAPTNSHVQSSIAGVAQLHVRLNRTKTGGRDVVLEPFGGPLCALAATETFQQRAIEAGFGSELAACGTWLPMVVLSTQHDGGRIRPSRYQTERNNLHRILLAAEVCTPEQVEDVALNVGTHTLRHVLPSACAAAGWSEARIAGLAGGAWAAGSPTPGAVYAIGGAQDVAAAVLEPEL